MRPALGNFASRYRSIFRHPDGVVPNTLALGYALGGHLLALVLLGMGGWWFVPGVLLLASSLVIAAFLIHECTHQTLFPPAKAGGPDRHAQLATVLAWLVGACYGDYPRI